MKSKNIKKDSTLSNNNKCRIFLYILLCVLLTASLIIGIMFATPSQDNYIKNVAAPKNDTETYVLDTTISSTTNDTTISSPSVDETVDCRLTIDALSIDLTCF